MARIPRLVVPGLSHHVTQRGTRRQRVFFSDGDCQLYLSLLSRWAAAANVEIKAYCLMPNHVHLIVIPGAPTSLAKLFRGLHSQYAEIVNARQEWKGHLWQQRYSSSVMDRAHLDAALRYVVLNPVRAELARNPLDWPWSSIKAHLGIADDPLLSRPTLQLDSELLSRPALGDELLESLRAASRTGRPVGSEEFVQRLEETSGRRLTLRKPGPRPALRAEHARSETPALQAAADESHLLGESVTVSANGDRGQVY